jgi:hypothetical protein
LGDRALSMMPDPSPKPNRDRQRVALWAFLGAVIVVVGYYIRHKPFDAIVALRWLAAGYDLLAAGLIVLLAGGLGHACLSRAKEDFRARPVIELAIGLGVVTFAVLGLGVLGALWTWLAWILTLVGLLVLWRASRAWFAGMADQVRKLKPEGATQITLMAVMLLIGVSSLLRAAAPPWGYDALVYHLAIPEQFAQSGRLLFTPDNPFWGNPMGAEMQYTWALLLTGHAASAAILGWLAGVFTLLGVMTLARPLGKTPAWVSGFSLAAGSTLGAALGMAYADWHAALYGLGVVIALMRWLETANDRWVVIAGIVGGLAAGTKYTDGLVLVSGLALILWGSSGTRRWRRAALYTSAFALVGLPWLARNWAFTGQPLYPFVGVSDWISPISQAFYRGSPSPGNLLSLLLLPFTSTLLGVEGAPGYAASLGPLMAALSLGILIQPVLSSREVRTWAVFFGGGLLVWMGAGFFSELLAQPRLYVAIFPAWALLAGAGFAGFSRIKWGRVRVARLTTGIVMLVAVLSGLARLGDVARQSTLGYWFGPLSAADYLNRNLGGYALAAREVRQIDRPSKVVMLWEPRGYYCQPVCVSDPWIDRWYTLRRSGLDNHAVVERWKLAGYSSVLLNQTGMTFIRQHDDRFTAADWNALDDLILALRPARQFGDGYTLYTLP